MRWKRTLYILSVDGANVVDEDYADQIIRDMRWSMNSALALADSVEEANWLFDQYRRKRITKAPCNYGEEAIEVLGSELLPKASMGGYSIGKRKTEKKTLAARENGKKGGRPRTRVTGNESAVENKG